MSDAILKFKMAAFGFLEHWAKQSNIPVDGYLRNLDDIQKPEIDVLRHFEIQDGNFWFMKNSQITRIWIFPESGRYPKTAN